MQEFEGNSEGSLPNHIQKVKSCRTSIRGTET